MWQRAVTVGASGGGNADEQIPIITSNSFSCSWGVNAESIIVIYKGNGTKHIVMFNTNATQPTSCWVTNESIAWQQGGNPATALSLTINVTPTSLSLSAGFTLTDVTVIPLGNKPIGGY